MPTDAANGLAAANRLAGGKLTIRRSFGNYFLSLPDRSGFAPEKIIFLDQRSSVSLVAPSLLVQTR